MWGRLGSRAELLTKEQLLAKRYVSDYSYRKEFGLTEEELYRESTKSRIINSFIIGAIAEKNKLESESHG